MFEGSLVVLYKVAICVAAGVGLAIFRLIQMWIDDVNQIDGE